MFLTQATVFAQQKFEREYRVEVHKVPEASQQVIKMWGFKEKIKWYVEESQDGKTFEAKVCHQKKKHSIEFSDKGAIIDVEIKIDFSELEKDIQANIKRTLSEKFRKFKIRKTQIQYTGSESAMYKAVFQLATEQETLTPKYELIVKGKVKKSYVKYELLFDGNGTIVKELQFAPQNTDNLEF